MAISSVTSAAAGLQNGGTIQSQSQSGKLSMEDFFTLMAAQLQYQDPSSSMDTNAYMSEMAEFGALEQLTAISSKMNYSVASGIVGKKVQYSRLNSQTGQLETGSGVVTAVDMNDGVNLKCQVGSNWEDISNITQIMTDGDKTAATA